MTKDRFVKKLFSKNIFFNLFTFLFTHITSCNVRIQTQREPWRGRTVTEYRHGSYRLELFIFPHSGCRNAALSSTTLLALCGAKYASKQINNVHTLPIIHPMSSLGTVISCDCWLVAGWLRDALEVRNWEPASAANAVQTPLSILIEI